MLTTREVHGVGVCRPIKPGREYTKDGVPRHRWKLGKIHKTVFSPDGLRVVGFIVRRPDLLWMFKRPERFLSLDALDIQEGLVVPSKGADSWDDRAIKRLDIDWDTCIIWEGMEVKTSKGVSLGFVDDISFDEGTGDLNSLFLDDGGPSRALVGSIEIPSALMVGYKKGALVVKSEAASLLPTGGLAGKAGEATARIGIEAQEGMRKAGEAAGRAVDKGTYGLGKAIGGLKRSVADAVDNYREESGSSERSAKSPSSAKASSAKKASGTSSSGKKSTSKSVGKAVGSHMKAAGSMFSDFKKEFDKASK